MNTRTVQFSARLRWLNRRTENAEGTIATITPVLQVAGIVQETGEIVWRDVPTVEDES